MEDKKKVLEWAKKNGLVNKTNSEGWKITETGELVYTEPKGYFGGGKKKTKGKAKKAK